MSKTQGLRRWRAVGVAVLSLVLLFAIATPALAFPVPIFTPIHALPFPLLVQGINGTVTNAGTAGPIKGIMVQAFNASDDSYAGTAFTNASGVYSIGLPIGTYHVLFSDPSGTMETQAYFNHDSLAYATNITVPFVTWVTRSQALQYAVRVQANVIRQGHPLTPLPGLAVVLVQKDSGGQLTPFNGTTNSNGSVAFAGLPHDDFQIRAYDPKAVFLAGVLPSSTTYNTYAGGTNNVIAMDLPLLDTTKDVTVTVPASKSKVTKNRAFTVTGKLSRRVTSPKTLKIVAIKGGTVKTFTANITALTSSSTYKCKKVKLPKGTWTLWAVFGGNSTWAPTDSGSGKVVRAR